MSSVLADARKFLDEEAASDLLDVVGATSTSTSTSTSTTVHTSASSDVFGDGDADEFILSIVDDKLHGAYEQEKLEVACQRQSRRIAAQSRTLNSSRVLLHRRARWRCARHRRQSRRNATRRSSRACFRSRVCCVRTPVSACSTLLLRLRDLVAIDGAPVCAVLWPLFLRESRAFNGFLCLRVVRVVCSSSRSERIRLAKRLCGRSNFAARL